MIDCNIDEYFGGNVYGDGVDLICDVVFDCGVDDDFDGNINRGGDSECECV